MENIFEPINIAIAKKQWINGLSNYAQSNCQCTLTDTGFRIYRPANLIYPDCGNTVWGGLRIDNSNNRFGLIKGHTYIIKFTVKGKSTNVAGSQGWTNQMGWGGGGLSPLPTSTLVNRPPSNFNGEMECSYKWTLSDDIYKVCTSSYSSFVKDTTYLSYKDFQFGFQYTSTGDMGTDLYLSNFRMYDITGVDKQASVSKQGILTCGNLTEEIGNTKFYKDSEITVDNFYEI